MNIKNSEMLLFKSALHLQTYRFHILIESEAAKNSAALFLANFYDININGANGKALISTVPVRRLLHMTYVLSSPVWFIEAAAFLKDLMKW